MLASGEEDQNSAPNDLCLCDCSWGFLSSNPLWWYPSALPETQDGHCTAANTALMLRLLIYQYISVICYSHGKFLIQKMLNNSLDWLQTSLEMKDYLVSHNFSSPPLFQYWPSGHRRVGRCLGLCWGLSQEWLVPAGRTGQVLHCTAVGACGCAIKPTMEMLWIKNRSNFLPGRLFLNSCLFMVPVYSVVPQTPCHTEESELQHKGGKV